MEALVRTRTRPCSFNAAIEEREDGAQERNDTLAQLYLRSPDNAELAQVLLHNTQFRQGEPTFPPGACLPLLP